MNAAVAELERELDAARPSQEPPQMARPSAASRYRRLELARPTRCYPRAFHDRTHLEVCAGWRRHDVAAFLARARTNGVAPLEALALLVDRCVEVAP